MTACDVHAHLQEEQRELAKTIRVSGSILLSTVSNFLDFFKIEAGKQLDIVRTPLDLRDLVSDVHCIIEAMVGREVRRGSGMAGRGGVGGTSGVRPWTGHVGREWGGRRAGSQGWEGAVGGEWGDRRVMKWGRRVRQVVVGRP